MGKDETIKAEDELKDSEDKLRILAEAMPVPLNVSRVSDGIVLFVNDSYRMMFGYNDSELVGRKTVDFYCYPDERDDIVGIINNRGFIKDREVKVKHKDGTPFWISATIRTITYAGEKAYLGVYMDITERMKKREELDKLNRILKALGDSAHAMMHADHEAVYLNDVCRIIINDCGYKMAWIGFCEEDEAKSVKPAAQAGFDKGYLKTLNITWADNERGRGPTGTAIRTEETAMCRNMLTDPCFKPWRKEALERGYASSIALPLSSGDKTFGALTIYSAEPDPFSKDEVTLLEELANDLAYGITFIRMREKNKEDEEKIKKVASFPELNPNPICEIDFDGNITYSNKAFKELFLDAEQKNFSHPFFTGLVRLIKLFKEKKTRFINREIKVNQCYYAQTVVHVPDSWGLRFYGMDITSRRKAEDQFKELYDELETKVYERTADLMRVNKKLAREIKTRREVEKKNRAGNAVLALLGKALSRKEYLEDLDKLIGRLSGCENHGIRIIDKKGNIPYEAYTGFTREFWESENWLSINTDHCVCTRVMRGKLESQDRSLATKTGSFCCGDMGKFVKELTRKQASRYREACVGCGFKSLAVIPIKYNNKIIGDIHLADKRKDKITKEFVEFMETLAPLMGEGIKKFDITDDMTQTNELLKEIFSSNELLDRIFSSGDFLIAQLDTNFNYIKVNDVFAKGVNHTPDFFPGKNYFSISPGEENKAIFRKVVKTGESYFAYAKPFEYAKNYFHNQTFWNWSLQPVKGLSGETESLVLVLVDVSRWKNAEEELEKTQKELADAKHLAEIGTLASTVAHELRNPLGVINIAAYNMKKKLPDPSMHRHLENIEKKVLESNQIITNLLTYSKMKMPVYKKIGIYSIIEECVDNASKRFGSQRTRVVKKYKPIKDRFIYIDPFQMKEVFSNILNNAFQAVESKKEKGRVEIEAVIRPHGFLSVSIKDNGTGIEKENLGKIFQPFYTSRSKGTGLGLAICRELVGLHNGKIDVDSAAGKGSTFTITIPIKGKV